ncbi:putative amidotransferase [Ascoidea rubescens DSM 1968]|uniref:Class I glutamine amidotransferase-like protein n=1 Tax=Ascoidea rubescens DSM 1968 TaxID=1344418 RepID=A0A1D2VDJ1_9ASCO|nr:class I glutamine amidotransferase-like protein [Ascoidea rubescens DSM 1968]ODV59652.1 class I glutamine amidotransferase-like protein [Ascoidea rubescens DSM 1968]
MTIDSNKKYISVFVLDTPISHDIYAEFGDFGDQGIELMKRSQFYDQEEIYFKRFDVIGKIELPDLGDAEQVKDLEKNCLGIYLTGSRSDSFTDEEWILRLSKFLREVLEKDDIKLPIVGICFGHQIIGRILGYKIGRNLKGWEIGATVVQLGKKFQEVIGELDSRQELVINESHQDVVFKELDGEGSKNIEANDFTIIGTSEICSNQGFISEKKKVLTFQGHPEFSKGFILKSLYEKLEKKEIDEDVIKQALESTELLKNDNLLIADLIVKFFLDNSK